MSRRTESLSAFFNTFLGAFQLRKSNLLLPKDLLLLACTIDPTPEVLTCRYLAAAEGGSASYTEVWIRGPTLHE